MGRIGLLIVVLVAVLLGVGFLALGAFPPDARTKPVEHVLPNDKFQR